MAAAAFLASKPQAGVSDSWNPNWNLLVKILKKVVPRLLALTSRGCSQGGVGRKGAGREKLYYIANTKGITNVQVNFSSLSLIVEVS